MIRFVSWAALYYPFFKNNISIIAAHPHGHTPIMLNTTNNTYTTIPSSTLTDHLIGHHNIPTNIIIDQSDINPHTTTSTIPIDKYSTICLHNDLWNRRIQDISCIKAQILLKTYNRSQLLPTVVPIIVNYFIFI